MKIAIIGRTHFLLETAKKLLSKGHRITFIYTYRGEKFYKAQEKDFEKFARQNKIPFFCDSKINKKYNILKKYNSEIALSMNYINIINKKIISLFKHGILNSHPGDLPKYKGNACPNWAILNFEKKIGLTIHAMTKDLDSGPILIKKYMRINFNTYIEEVYSWMEQNIPKLFIKSIAMIGSKKFKFKKQKGSTLRVYPRLKIDDKINWNLETKKIIALIRSSSRPFQGCYSFLHNEKSVKKVKIRIFKARKYTPKFKFLAVPGQLCLINNNNPVIATLDGMVEILDCSYKKQLTKSLRNRLV